MEIITFALLTAIAKLWVLLVIFPAKNVAWAAPAIDVFVVFFLPIFFYGSYHALMIAIFSGLWLSVFLLGLRLLVGVERPKWTKIHEQKSRYRTGKSRGSFTAAARR